MSQIAIPRKLVPILFRYNVINNLSKNSNTNCFKRCFTSGKLPRLHSYANSRRIGVKLCGVGLGCGIVVACVEHFTGHNVFAETLEKFGQSSLEKVTSNEKLLAGSLQNESYARESSNSPGSLEEERFYENESKEGKTAHVENEERFDWAQLTEILTPYWKRLLFAVGV